MLVIRLAKLLGFANISTSLLLNRLCKYTNNKKKYNIRK